MDSPRAHPPLGSGAARFRGFAPVVGLAIAGLALLATPFAVADRGDASGPRPTIVLVHGAWADGSSWSRVTSRLQASGYDVRVPPNNLRGVASDAADLASYLSTIPGPIVLVGHSYGGIVISNAATASNADVRSLVFVNAFIPGEGEPLLGLIHPPSIFAQEPANVFDFVPYNGAPSGVVDLYVKPAIYRDAFAKPGLASREISVLAATQRPLSTQVLGEPSGPPAWSSTPAWAVVGTNDRIIPVADQISMAERAGARVVKVDAPHLSMITHDRAVSDVIEDAAQAN